MKPLRFPFPQQADHESAGSVTLPSILVKDNSRLPRTGRGRETQRWTWGPHVPQAPSGTMIAARSLGRRDYPERGYDGMRATPKTTKCEHCGKRINVKSRTCPFCAGRSKDRVVPRKAVCPRCEVPLKIHLTGDREEYDICPQCGGLWLDRTEFHRATRKPNVYRHTKQKGEYLRGPVRDPVQYVVCVRCGQRMNRKNFGHISGVIIDECRSHGVWLDGGELEKIQHFIADGGLEKSRDREIEQVRTELKELANKVDTVSFSHKIIHFWNPKRWLFSGFR